MLEIIRSRKWTIDSPGWSRTLWAVIRFVVCTATPISIIWTFAPLDKSYGRSSEEARRRCANEQKRGGWPDLEFVIVPSSTWLPLFCQQFIKNALEDAHKSRQKREHIMRSEIEDSQVMIIKAKELIGSSVSCGLFQASVISGLNTYIA